MKKYADTPEHAWREVYDPQPDASEQPASEVQGDDPTDPPMTAPDLLTVAALMLACWGIVALLAGGAR